MYAIVEIAGQQYKIQKDKKVFVHRLEAEEGAKVDFDRVLLIDNGSSVTVGSPSIEGAMISATVLGHLKGDKVIVFKKKRRKGYQKKNGHRQYLTQIIVEDIFEKDAKPSKTEKKVATQKAEVKESKEEVQIEKASPATSEKKTEASEKKSAPKKTVEAKKESTSTAKAKAAPEKKTAPKAKATPKKADASEKKAKAKNENKSKE